MKNPLYLLLLALPVVMFSCKTKVKNVENMSINKSQFITGQTIEKIEKDLGQKFGAQKSRIAKGVKQAASFWTAQDGSIDDFEKFCNEKFIGNDTSLEVAFQKLSTNYEILTGNFNKMSLDLRMPLDLNQGEVTPIDMLFGGYDPQSHVLEDFFRNKIAFVVLLNFPYYSLDEKTSLGKSWTRKEWAYARMGDIYNSRVPADLLQNLNVSTTNADAYISDYNIYMGNLLNSKGQTVFPKNLKLITHWGLRDELKSDYALADGLEKQRLIYEVMKRIITQEIPLDVINKDTCQWNPQTNKLFQKGKEISFKPEPDTRYQHLLENFLAEKAIDKYSPMYPTFIQRNFDEEMEIPQQEVEKLFVEFVSSAQVKKVAELISKRLGRKLEPFDIWYDGFKPRGSIAPEELDQKVSAKYPSKESLEKDLPNLLVKLGFKPERAKYITSKVQLDAARGSGHAAGAYMKSDKARLRTRITDHGMDYKGYNIAIHEFGHTVEQTITLQDVDYYMLSGVPNTSFTEALAFIFQRRDLELLGMKDNDPNKKSLMTLDVFWGCYEIMGVSLVDMNVWKWMYAHPDANAAQLKEAVTSISKEVWNKYFAGIFGVKDQPILAVYSHMIDYPLYLSAYPVGQIIEFQIDKQIEGKSFADEIQRIFVQGRIIPDLWLKGATGTGISNTSILEATDEALKSVK
jgi:hypothetical protein